MQKNNRKRSNYRHQSCSFKQSRNSNLLPNCLSVQLGGLLKKCMARVHQSSAAKIFLDKENNLTLFYLKNWSFQIHISLIFYRTMHLIDDISIMLIICGLVPPPLPSSLSLWQTPAYISLFFSDPHKELFSRRIWINGPATSQTNM